MLKSLLIASLVSFSVSGHAVCESMSEAKANLVVDLINTQVKASPTHLATLDASVMFKNIKKAKVVKTETGYSQIALITTNSTAQLPYAIISLDNAYLKINGTDQSVNLGHLAACNNVSEMKEFGFQLVRDL